ncbi:MAG: hypothetical protein ACK5MD_00890 [Flavobacteriales bacterium]
MFRISLAILSALLSIACKKVIPLEKSFHYTYIKTDSIQTLDDSAFLALKNIPNDSLYIINFWAKRSQKSIQNRRFLSQIRKPDFQLIQINLDYKSSLKMLSDSFLSNDYYYKPSSFSVIDSSWNGLLPATLFITKDTLIFETKLLNKKSLSKHNLSKP